MSRPLADLRATLRAAAAALRGGEGGRSRGPRLERPKREGLGDFSTNAAMLLAPVLDTPPRVIAERLGGELDAQLGHALEAWEVAGPGFLNLTMSDGWLRAGLAAVLAAGEALRRRRRRPGRASPDRVRLGQPDRSRSSPPVGRHAAYGDALARILEHHGH